MRPKFNDLVEKAIEETKIGGDPAKGQVLATLALGVAILDLGISTEISDLSRSVQSVADAIEMTG